MAPSWMKSGSACHVGLGLAFCLMDISTLHATPAQSAARGRAVKCGVREQSGLPGYESPEL